MKSFRIPVAWLALALGCACARADDAGAQAAAGHRAAPLPAADFLVEWRIRPADAQGGVVITSGSAATGSSGFGPGAVVVGTAAPASPQSLRVANGKEGSVLLDRSQTRTVYDMAWSASASSAGAAPAGAASGVAAGGKSRSQAGGVRSHEVEIHRVDGLRVRPRWVRGDTLELDLALMHSGSSRAIDVHAVVQAGFDAWLTVASVGEGGDELQVRVSRR